MKYLRQYIRQVLSENVLGPQELAVIHKSYSNFAEAVIYDPSALLHILYDVLESSSGDDKILGTLAQRLVDEDISKGFVEIGEPPQDDGRCNDAWEVSISAGPRYGNVLYKVAFGLAQQNGKDLTSDRGGSSPKAQTRWEKESAGRDKHPFDDITDPKTPPPEDDCKLQSNPTLNFSYGAGSGDMSMFEELQKNHSKFLEEVDERFSVLNPKTVQTVKGYLEKVLLKSSGKLWNKHRPR